MLKQLTAFEIRYHTRQVGFWITIVIMFLLGFAIIAWPNLDLGSESGEKIKANGALAIAGITSGLSLAALFFGAIFVVSGVMRDDVHKSLELVHSTPVSTRDMTLSRMIGVYIATFLCLSVLLLGLFVGQFMPWVDEEILGPINLFYFLYPALVFIAINTLWVSGAFTTIAAITRNRALVYVSAVGFFIATTVVELLVAQDVSDLITSLVDPFGAAAMSTVTEFWSAAEQNNQLVPLWGLVGLNRLLWGALGLLLFVFSFSLFKRGLASSGGKLRHEEGDDTTTPTRIQPVTPSKSFGASLSALSARFKYEYFTTIRSIPFIILTLLAFTLFALSIYVQMILNPNPALPTSALLSEVVAGSLIIPLLIIMVFFSGEIIWRDKTAGISEIIDSSAVKNESLLAGKWLALFAVIVTLLGVAIITGITAQIILGDIPINLPTFLSLFFVNLLPRLLLFCILVLFIQNFMPNRVVGMLVSGAFAAFFFIAINFLPFAHPLMQYGAVGAGGWSELNGFSSLVRMTWFGLYWGSLAALFVVLSVWLWRRGTEASFVNRVKSIGSRISGSSAILAVLLLVGFVATGGYIYKAYNIDNDFRTSKQAELRQVEREKFFGTAYQEAVPKVLSVEANVVFNPSKQTATFSGKYILKNTTDQAFTEVYINKASSHDEDIIRLELSGASPVTKGDDIETIEGFGYRLFKFDTPLEPGATTSLSFETYFHEPRLGDGGLIERNGSFINNFVGFPHLGIADRRMRNSDKRRKYGLPEYEKRPDRTDLDARQNHFIRGELADYVDFKATVCTDIGQIPIAPGKMLRKYEQDGKACRDYQTIQPILNFFAFLSADFEVKRDTWVNPNGADVPLAIYYHETHDYNVDLMLDAVKSSFDTFTTLFGPYQYNQVRIMEFPYGGFAQAFAGTIPFSERIGFVMDAGDPDDNTKIDLATYVTIHEIGHQWFAHQIVPANTKGFNVLSEGLTENAAMTAYEAKLGWQKARKVLEVRAIEAYLAGRTRDREDEPPLAKAEQQQYLDYQKASWVFWGLKQNMGEELMQGAIRGFLEEYGSKGPLYPTTMQLVEHLRAAAPEDMQLLITDYWDRIVFWDMKIENDVEISPNLGGGYTVSFDVKLDKKIASEEDGKETSVTEIDGEELNEWLEIGFYDEDPKDTWGDEWLKLERVRITELETKLSFDLDQRPNFVLLDPRRLLIERDVKDNVKKTPKDKLASN
ncbi:MAG: hypothetical protein COA60_004470 [Robiginitomaculum sp.]|nr:hypothetical protein [Robiginitomaculum sp.]